MAASDNQLFRKVMNDLFTAQLERAKQQNNVIAEAARPAVVPRPKPALPPVNARTQELFNSLIGSSKTSSGVSRGTPTTKFNTAAPMLASRADMIAAQSPVQQDSQWPTPPPGWGTQAEWDALTEPERQQVAEQVKEHVQGTANMPADVAAGHNLTTTDADKVAQMYGDTRGQEQGGEQPEIIPYAPIPTTEDVLRYGPEGGSMPVQNNVQPNVAQFGASTDEMPWELRGQLSRDRQEAAAKKRYAQPGAGDQWGTGEEQPIGPEPMFGPGHNLPVGEMPKVEDFPRADMMPDYTQVPDNWTGTPEQWAALPDANKAGIWESHYAYLAQTQEPYNPLDSAIEGVVPEFVQDAAVDASQYAWDSPPGQIARDAGEKALAALDWGAKETRSSTGEAAYYMATNNGERPPDDLSSLSSWIGSLTNVMGGVYELSQYIYETMGGDREASEQAFLQLSMLNYLDEHPEVLADVKIVYEQAIAGGASEQEAGLAVWDWFYAQQGLIPSLLAGTIWDPLNLIPVAGWAGKRRLLAGAEAAAAGRKGTAAINTVEGTILNAPQAVLDTLGEVPGKILKGGWSSRYNPVRGLTAPSESVVVDDALQGVDEAADIAAGEGMSRTRTATEQELRDAISTQNAKVTPKNRQRGLDEGSGGAVVNKAPDKPKSPGGASAVSPERGETLTPTNRQMPGVRTAGATVDNVADDITAPVIPVGDDAVEVVESVVPGFVSRMGANRTTEEIAEFYDEIAPLVTRQIEKDDALRTARAAEIDAPGYTGSRKLDTEERMVNETVTQAAIEVLYRRKFGEPSAYVRDFKNAAGTPQGAVERAIFGTDEESIAAFQNLSRYAANGNQVISENLDYIIKARKALTGLPDNFNELMSAAVPLSGKAQTRLAEGVSPRVPESPITASRVDSAADAGPQTIAKGDAHFDAPVRSGPITRSSNDVKSASKALDDIEENLSAYQGSAKLGDVGSSYDNEIDELIDHAVFGSEDDFAVGPRGGKGKKSPGSATRARDILRNKYGMSDEADRAKDLRRQIFGDDIDSFKKQDTSLGLVHDPQAEAKRWFAGTSERIDAIKSRVLTEGNGSTAVPPPAEMKTWVDGAISDGSIVSRQRGYLETPVELTLKRNGADVNESWTFVDRLGDNFSRQRAQAMKRAKFQISKQRKALTDEQADAFVEQFMKSFNDDYETALNKTIKEFKTAIRGQKNWTDAKAVKAWQNFANFHRQNLQFNIVNGSSAAMQDWLSNAFNALKFGEFGSIKRVFSIQKALWRKAAKDGVEIDILDVVPQGDFYKAIGKEAPRDYLTGSFARAQLEGSDKIWTEHKWTGLFKPLAMPVIKKFRVTADAAWRLSTHANSLKREVQFGMAKYMKTVESYAKRIDDESLIDDIRALGTDGGFSPDKVRDVLRTHNIKDDTLARTWAQELDTRWLNAKNKTDKIFFTYKKTKVDDYLSQVFMFHYFMTRSAPQQIQWLMQHPGMANLYQNLWNSQGEFGSEVAPPWMKSWMKFWSDNGLYGMADGLSFVMTFSSFMHYGEQGGFNDTTLEKWMNKTGLFFAPQLRAAFATMGWMKPGDPLAASKVFRAAVAAVDEVRNGDHDWIPEGLKQDPGFTGNPYQDLVDSFYRNTQRWATELGVPFAEQTNIVGWTDKKQEEAELVLTNMFEDMYGPRFDDNGDPLWTEEQIDEWNVSYEDLHSGTYDDPYVQDAIQQVSRKDALNMGLDAVSPVPAAVRIEESDALYQDRSDAYDRSSNGEKQPGDTNLIATGEAGRIAPGQPTELASGMDEYNAVGTEEQEYLHKGWTDIVHNLGDYPDNYQLTVGGQVYTVAELNKMTEQERMDLADQWVKQQQLVQGATTTGELPDNRAYEQFKNERGRVREANPVTDDFLTYRTWMFGKEDEAGGVRQARTDMENANPDSEFSRAIARKREQLMARGLTGEELELELDKWMTTEEAYVAVRGLPWKSDDPTGTSLFDPLSEPWRTETQEAAKGSSGAETNTDNKKPPRKDSAASLRFRDLGYFIGDKGTAIRKETYPWRQDRDSSGGNRYTGTSSDNFLQEFLLR